MTSDEIEAALGSARTALADNNTDYYPVLLSQDTLRPGTMYADPYGHILMIVRRVAQTENAAGIILAVDGQPDGTVTYEQLFTVQPFSNNLVTMTLTGALPQFFMPQADRKSVV